MSDKPENKEVNELVAKATIALTQFKKLDQETVDYIVKKASVAALNQHGVLAKAAVDETGRGRFEDKATKNLFAAEHVTNYLKKQKTVGVIERDEAKGLIYVAEPIGVIAGVTPVTNPTSTAIFKALISLKTRNPIIFGFHPGAQNSSAQAAKVVYDAAVAAGAPKDCIQWITKPSLEASNALMHHDGVATILATGGNAMVKAAYSCGKPALGVGAGNVPVYVEKSANIKRAANDLVVSKNFDYGMICASEQAAIIDKEVYDEYINESLKLKAYMCTPAEKAKLEKFIFGVEANSKNCSDRALNPNIVGKSPVWLAEQAGFKVPEDTSVIYAEVKDICLEEPLTFEKLSSILAIYKAKNTDDGIAKSEKMLEQGGLGHTACIQSENQEIIEKFGEAVNAVRVLVNQPTSLGGIGDVYNAIIPSLTLGCGSYGHNSVSNNVQAPNLLNIKRIARRNNNMQWFKVPSKIYFEPNAIQYLQEMSGLRKVMIVADPVMSKIGVTQKVIDQLLAREGNGVAGGTIDTVGGPTTGGSNHVQGFDGAVQFRIIDNVEPEPSIDTVEAGVKVMDQFGPDTIIAVGGGSVMDAAKVMRLRYEHPEITFADIREKFFDIRKRAFTIPSDSNVKLVCIPTTSGTGSEVTPFAVITDHKTGYKYPIADYALTADVAIVDPELAKTQPGRVACDSGYDAITHSVEAYVSVYANDYTDGLALHALKLLYNNIYDASVKGDELAKKRMHNAATLAGMAFGSGFLGICHGVSHTIGAATHTAHGRSNAILLPTVIRYNAQAPTKPTSWPKYESYTAAERYADIAKHLGIKFDEKKPGDAAEALATALEKLRDKLDMPNSYKAAGVDEKTVFPKLDSLAMRVFEDQCTPANPRVPIIEEIKDIVYTAFYGVSLEEGKKLRLKAEK